MAVPTTGGDTVSGRTKPTPLIIGGSATPALADAVARQLGTAPTPCVTERFPDGEAHVAVGTQGDPEGRGIRGGDVYVVQSTGPPVDANLMELALLADACWREDAARVTAVVPYLGYARQDRRPARGEAVAVRMVAEIMEAAAIDRVLVVDPHTPALESVFGVPLEAVSALPVLVDALSAYAHEDSIVVAPDLGAVKLAERIAGSLGVPAAFVRKSRLSGTTVETSGVVGEVAGRRPILVDDMISTAGTLAAADAALRELAVSRDLVVAAPHGLSSATRARSSPACPCATCWSATRCPCPPTWGFRTRPSAWPGSSRRRSFGCTERSRSRACRRTAERTKWPSGRRDSILPPGDAAPGRRAERRARPIGHPVGGQP